MKSAPKTACLGGCFCGILFISNQKASRNLGTACGIKGDTQKTIDYFSEAIKRGASTGETYMNRGIAYFNLNQAAKALPNFEKSLTMKNEKQTQERGFLATAYLATGNATKALENFNQVIVQKQFIGIIKDYRSKL